MKYFYGCTFMSQDELASIGVKYPIKLEYYKTKTNEKELKNQKDIRYGIEVIKTSYIQEKVDVERKIIPNIIKDELEVEEILNMFKFHKVTPVSAEYIIEDLLKTSKM